MDNYMSLKILSKLGNETFARSVVAAFASQLNPTVDQINDIKTAVSEAVTNSIVHGYSSEEEFVTIDVLLHGGSVHITVTDQGVGIADVASARQPFFTTKPEDERTGMGFTIMDAFMDTLEVTSDGKMGVKVKMSKTITK
jgi:stage II sporulation protein AB (anti-sigma F factor)